MALPDVTLRNQESILILAIYLWYLAPHQAPQLPLVICAAVQIKVDRVQCCRRREVADSCKAFANDLARGRVHNDKLGLIRFIVCCTCITPQRRHRLDKHCAFMQKLQHLNLDDAYKVNDVRKKKQNCTVHHTFLLKNNPLMHVKNNN